MPVRGASGSKVYLPPVVGVTGLARAGLDAGRGLRVLRSLAPQLDLVQQGEGLEPVDKGASVVRVASE